MARDHHVLHTDSVASPDHDTTPYMERGARETLEVGLAVLLDGVEAAITTAAQRRGPDAVAGDLPAS